LSAAIRGRVVARFGPRYLLRLDVAPDAAVPGPGGAQARALASEVDAVARGRRMDVVVGDRVQATRERELYVIESVEPRRNLLFRSDASHTKPLAANVDQVAIVFAIQPPPQKEFVWRALLAARSAGIASIAILNKTDLESGGAQSILDDIAALGGRVLRVSARTDPEGTRARLARECAGRATLFVGQSGMGKSTLLQLLIGAAVRTGALTRRGTHGRQTTTATRWFPFGPDGAVIDTPGFHEFGLAHLPATRIISWMPEFAAIDQPCRFDDCRHAEEPGCQIRMAVERGAISQERYAFYRKLCAEEAAYRRAERGF
jgi:ribosome biogenesis GTPase